MKTLMVALFLCFTVISIQAQSENDQQRDIQIKEIGLGFQVPAGFILLDSKPMESANKYSGKGYFLRKNRDFLAYTIGRFPNDTDQSWDKMSDVEKSHAYNIVKNTNNSLTYDSLSSSMNIGKVNFNKFSVIGKKGTQVEYAHIELKGFYNGYRVTIVYNVHDLQTANEIEAVLLNPNYISKLRKTIEQLNTACFLASGNSIPYVFRSY